MSIFQAPKWAEITRSVDIFHPHEVFEIEVLDRLQRARVLENLVFGGGTMLRLCHELNRYSVDMDFWFIRDVLKNDLLMRVQKPQ